MKKLAVIVLFALACGFVSCSSDDDGNMMEPTNSVKYTATIKPIMEASCTSCHGDPLINGAPMMLLTLDQVKEAVQNRNLIGRIEDGSMPPGNAPDLSAAQIQAVKDWEAGNFQD